ncbi:MAG TPA: hypothetical protein VKH82_03235 [Candidatus Binatia bacterium]|nr:hypothetical protein [Candidatus Binatia bacterium]
MPTEDLPDVAAVVGPMLQRVPREHRPLLIAVAERLAAVRYRAWASEVGDSVRASRLSACADREEEIARRIESLYADASSIQRDLVAKHPELDEVNRSLFAGRPLHDQFAIQARGERVGAATWRYFAERAETAAARDQFLLCADLEEESAGFLESQLDGRR